MNWKCLRKSSCCPHSTWVTSSLISQLRRISAPRLTRSWGWTWRHNSLDGSPVSASVRIILCGVWGGPAWTQMMSLWKPARVSVQTSATRVMGLLSDEQCWLSFPLEEFLSTLVYEAWIFLHPIFQWGSFFKLLHSAKSPFSHWFYFHMTLTFQLMIFFSSNGYQDLYSNIKNTYILHTACTTYCSKHCKCILTHLFFIITLFAPIL